MTSNGSGVDRRSFLAGLAVAGVTVGCAGGSDEGGSGGTGAPLELAQPAPSDLATDSFSLGVASGDPMSDRVILWTRLASDPLAVDGAPPPGEVEVAWDVATDADFEDLVGTGIAVASPELGHAIHVDVSGLEPDTWYHYRFRAGDQTSPVGRTRTFPTEGADAERFRFVFASCQDFQWGRYGAWGRASEQPDVDAVVFLGDYIYELNLGDVSPDQSGERVWAGPEPYTVEDYRRRYAQTKADPQLRAAHAMAPWIITWDDHEVSNNYAGDVGQADVDQPASADRRRAAYQAWYEHTPIRITPEPEDFEVLDIHRSFAFGNLASLFSIETRQHADAPACRDPETPDLLSDEGPLCEAALDESRTNLGEAQERWLVDAIGDSEATWNLLANPIMFASIDIGSEGEPAFSRDAWVGYPGSQKRVIDAIVESEVANPVVVTGDWHASFVLDVEREPGGEPVMPEFVISSISTVLFSDDYRDRNPNIRWFAAEHGFALVTVTPEELLCEFHHIEDVWDADTPVGSVDRWRVASGSRTAEPA